MRSPFLPFPQVIERYSSDLDVDAILKVVAARELVLQRSCWSDLRDVWERLPSRDALVRKNGLLCIDTGGSCVSVGEFQDLLPEERKNIHKAINLLTPWRKGPLGLFGETIDAEWRSDLKWNRIVPALDLVEGARVADIGCGNGYYMFRMLDLNPELVIGIDPSEQFWFSFGLFQRFIDDPRLAYMLGGVEDLGLFPGFFDVALCMGVIYHQRDPFQALRLLKSCLKPGGRLLLESQVILGEEPVALCPPGRYAKMRNVYFVPTARCLAGWLEKMGFEDVRVLSVSELSSVEQRATPLGPEQSLVDFLHPEKPDKTVEGYPAPLRAAVVGHKPDSCK